MRRITLTALIVLVLCPAILFAGGVGTTAWEFLKMDTGARPIAMGGSFAALADDVNALNWNPAGLNQLKRQEVAFTHIAFFEGISSEYIGYVHPLDKDNCLGGSITLFSAGSIEKRTDQDKVVVGDETYSASDFAVSVSYSRRIDDKLNLGGTLKMIIESIEDTSAFGLAIDAGALYKVDDRITAAVVLQNIGPGVKFIENMDSLPMNIKIGGVMRLNVANRPLNVAADINLALLDAMSLSIGAEYIIEERFAARLGLKTKAWSHGLSFFSALSLGIGFADKLNDNMNYGIDYSIAPYGELGLTHRLSLILKM